MDPIFAGTVCDAARGTIAWEVIYNKLEGERPKITITRATVGSTKPSGTQCRDASCSFLHRIGARDKILPYTDMNRWAVENLTIEDRQFNNSRMELVGSFRAEDLKAMYHIPDLQEIYNTFVANFVKNNPDPFKLI